MTINVYHSEQLTITPPIAFTSIVISNFNFEPNVEPIPSILLLDASLIRSITLSQFKSIPEHIALLSQDSTSDAFLDSCDRFFLKSPYTQSMLGGNQSQAAIRYSAMCISKLRAEKVIRVLHTDIDHMNQIGASVLSERELTPLLQLILKETLRLTQSDAGSIYLLEKDIHGKKQLLFHLAHNESLPKLKLEKVRLPLDESSLAGYTALSKYAFCIEDVYNIEANKPYSFNQKMDSNIGYRSRSMLMVPMLDLHGNTVGVLQLVNKKKTSAGPITNKQAAKNYVDPFTDNDIERIQWLSGIAAVSIDNSKLHLSIERLFEGFIKAAVIAIDQRDPTTSGHSVRVAHLTCSLAKIIDQSSTGYFKNRHFNSQQIRELRYAALLHDFGKVAVRESVLVKEKKLPPILSERINNRFSLVEAELRCRYYKQRADYLIEYGRHCFQVYDNELIQQLERDLGQIEIYRSAYMAANQPHVLAAETADCLQDLVSAKFKDRNNNSMPLIHAAELDYLQIAKGSLSHEERLEIESHVSQTYRFLSQIPWTDDLASVPNIAHGHHEKLDGSGYPLGLNAVQISLPTRIMTIADIFDALTAQDRPYKPALSEERSLDILAQEAKNGRIDTRILQLMIETGVYHDLLTRQWETLI